MDKAAMALDFEQIHGKDTTDLAPANRDQSPSAPRPMTKTLLPASGGYRV